MIYPIAALAESFTNGIMLCIFYSAKAREKKGRWGHRPWGESPWQVSHRPLAISIIMRFLQLPPVSTGGINDSFYGGFSQITRYS